MSPNPTSNMFEVSLGSYHIYEIKIIDLQGKNVTDKTTNTKTETHWIVNVENLNQGIFTLIINGKYYSRFMKIWLDYFYFNAIQFS